MTIFSNKALPPERNFGGLFVFFAKPLDKYAVLVYNNRCNITPVIQRRI